MHHFLLASILLIVANLASAAWHGDTHSIMGTRVHVEFWWPGDVPSGEALLAECFDEVHRLDSTLSPYKDASALSKMNRLAATQPIVVDDELYALLARAEHFSTLTNGAFDVTYASVGRFYDYRNQRLPTEAERAAVEAINYRYVERDDEARTVHYRHPQVYVDLGGIAKGYAVDRVAQLLAARGVRHASVSAGGDSRILGDRRGKPWSVGVRDPRQEGRVVAVLPLVDTAVSTSGDYERFFEQDGRRYHHILDPATGESAEGAMSVTILGSTATDTDALSTSVFVLGVERGLELVNDIDSVDAIIISPDGVMHYSKGLESLHD